MALTNEEKVQVLQEAACEFFRGLDTIPAWVSFVNNVTKAQVKAFLKNAIQNAANRLGESSTFTTTKEAEYNSFADDVEAL